MLILSLKAMTKSQYAKQLQRPEWKAKRLEILERDGNKCVKCGETKRLHVHHLSYTKGRDAWEYPNDNLVTLCGECHVKEHEEVYTSKTPCSHGEFIQVYLEDMMALTQLASKGEIHIMLWLWKSSTYIDSENSMGNKIIINKQLYSIISDNTGLTEGAIRNVVSSLVKKDLLIKDAKFRGVYYLHPKLFFKGKLSDRERSFKFVRGYKRLKATH